MLHFVGFRGDEYNRACVVFGLPDFIHFHWDSRAVSDVDDGDTVVFANGHSDAFVQKWSYNDSEFF